MLFLPFGLFAQVAPPLEKQKTETQEAPENNNEVTTNSDTTTDEMLAKVNEGIPMKRHATPEEIGALYAFLASDDAQYITGADIRIDGGETAGLYS